MDPSFGPSSTIIILSFDDDDFISTETILYSTECIFILIVFLHEDDGDLFGELINVSTPYTYTHVRSMNVILGRWVNEFGSRLKNFNSNYN